MKKNNKLVLLGAALTMTAGLSMVGASVNADQVINAGQYTESAQQLQQIFTNKNKNFSLKEVSVENHNDNKQEPVYELEGFNAKKTQSAKMVVNAEKTNEVIKNKTKKMSSSDKKDANALNVNDVKKSPVDAINLAKKYANVTGNPTSWKLEMTKVNGNETPVYEVEFDGTATAASSSSASSAKSSSVKNAKAKKSSKASSKKATKSAKKVTVKLNATNGNKIAVENDD
ncbi:MULTISPECIES: PepSY domain-containing protein [Ligilactobacillus]|uniref:PepSY domain-containing protein n=1 Tax=Ligilactobacillus TaxID=2767887 RepID=UPI0024BA4741|nr:MULTISPECIES: PepSY domain-containing protein [Ligilactobacillus]MDO3392513.1 PepSY domain-containing protein [Ligilactobacillus sp. 110_WCHN]